MCFTTTSAVPFMKYSGIHMEKGRYMVVCHDLGAPYFTVDVLSCGTEHDYRAEKKMKKRGRFVESSYSTLNVSCESRAAADTLTVTVNPQR